jgi:PmbA protein
MEKLLEMAGKVADGAEIYALNYSRDTVSFENATLHEVGSTFQNGVSLRIIKDGKLGFAYTRNLRDRNELLENALKSLRGGVEAPYEFPLTRELPKIDAYDPAVERMSTTDLFGECRRICDRVQGTDDAVLDVTAIRFAQNLRILNTRGTDVSGRESYAGAYFFLKYPGTGGGMYRGYLEKGFEPMPDDLIDELVGLYGRSKRVVNPKGGRMKVLFMPNGFTALKWRIMSGTNAKSVYEGISPIANRIGEPVFSEGLTVSDDPTDDRFPEARAFDDEGVPCRGLTLIENGVLKGFYSDLNYAKKTNATSTGHGFRTSRYGGDGVTIVPEPNLMHFRIEPGKHSTEDLIRGMDRGLILEGGLGPHSGNIPNGDYSVGVNPGLYVENGEIVGRVKDAMVAGNIYETLQNVVSVGSSLYPSFSWGGGWLPPVLCEGVSVATKS